MQDHIKSLNFGYRVSLREAGITYVNKLGRFVGPNQLECTDNKGKSQVITAARFVVAVGGRPTPPDCEGAELAITSDDIFKPVANLSQCFSDNFVQSGQGLSVGISLVLQLTIDSCS